MVFLRIIVDDRKQKSEKGNICVVPKTLALGTTIASETNILVHGQDFHNERNDLRPEPALVQVPGANQTCSQHVGGNRTSNATTNPTQS